MIATHDALVASRCDRIVRLLDGSVLDELDVPTTVEPEALLDRISRMDP
jgi:ABC-type lipoprotein export system ATPase subunit